MKGLVRTLLIMGTAATFQSYSCAADNPPKTPLLESYSLGQVVLNPYPDGLPTPFMKHRDKFIGGLADTNPDDFLYNFRDAFGQPQPKGARQLGVWEDKTCRLRGHASGHYLSAMAQAYASTTYDAELHELFKKKMDYMVGVLYDLSQMSGKPAKPGGPHASDPTRVPAGPGKDTYDSDLSEDGALTTGTGEKALSAPIRRTSSSCSNTAQNTARAMIRYGRHTTLSIKSSPD